MQINQLAYIAVVSCRNIINKRDSYGFSNIKDSKDLITLTMIIDILKDADWYSLPTQDIVKLTAIVTSIIRDNKLFVFDVPISGIYANANLPQTSFTYDEIY